MGFLRIAGIDRLDSLPLPDNRRLCRQSHWYEKSSNTHSSSKAAGDHDHIHLFESTPTPDFRLHLSNVRVGSGNS